MYPITQPLSRYNDFAKLRLDINEVLIFDALVAERKTFSILTV